MLTNLTDKFIDAIEKIEKKLNLNEDPTIDIGERALTILSNENVKKLADILFDGNKQWSDDFKKFDSAGGFMECWDDEDHVLDFSCRIFALRMAFLCDVYLQLNRYKHLRNLEIEEYMAHALPKLLQKIEKNKEIYFKQIDKFISAVLFFTDVNKSKLIRSVIKKMSKKRPKEWTAINTENVVSHISKMRSSQLPNELILEIVKKPMVLAELLIKDIYRNLFKQYDPFYLKLGFKFDMNSWIPIKLVAENNREETGLFKLIKNGLESYANELKVGSLVVITGK
jgi:hypothetical protein